MNQKKKFCFIIETPLSKRDEERFGLNIISTKFQIIIIDLSIIRLKRRRLLYCYKDLDDLRNKYKYYEVRNSYQLLSIMNDQIEYFVDYSSGEYFTSIIALLIIKYRNKKVIFTTHGISPIHSTSLSKELKKRLLFKSISNIRYLIDRIYKYPFKFINTLNVNILGVSCLKVLKDNLIKRNIINSSTKIVFNHSFDYDLYLKHRNEIKISDEYILFLCQDYTNHPDLKIQGRKQIDKKRYYNDLKKFFSELENLFNKKILISVHPRSNLKHNKLYWGKFNFSYEKSLFLSAKASIVLTHHSTAVSFPIIYKKPIIFFTSNLINNNFVEPVRIKKMAISLNKKVINLDDYNTDSILSSSLVNNYDYDQYISNYVKHPNSKDINSWELMIQDLN